MINPFNCVNPSARADASNLLHFDQPHHRPVCSSTLLALKAVTATFLRMTTTIFHLAFHIALLSIPLWIILTIVPPIVNWVKRYHEKLEIEGEDEEKGTVPWSHHLWNIWRELMSVASDRSDRVRRLLSPTSVPDFGGELNELYPIIAKCVLFVDLLLHIC